MLATLTNSLTAGLKVSLPFLTVVSGLGLVVIEVNACVLLGNKTNFEDQHTENVKANYAEFPVWLSGDNKYRLLLPLPLHHHLHLLLLILIFP